MRAACILGLAIFVVCLGIFVPGSAFAGGAIKRHSETGTTDLKKMPAENRAATLEMSLEQAMWTALAFEDAAKLRDLIKRGADPNKPEKLSLMTPLMAAETEAIAHVLLKAGADPNMCDRTGRTALHHAVKMRQAASVVRLLGKAGADINARAGDLSGSTPLISAVEHYIEDKDRNETALAIRILAHLGADLDLADAGGRTPLALAAANNQPELIKLLIELGADPVRPMANGQTPLDYARAANAKEAMQALAAAPSKQAPAN
jgi:ankyrin repeat protein